nr:hypothetical protein Itr_chr08CG22050 [Ipomoea trifida]
MLLLIGESILCCFCESAATDQCHRRSLNSDSQCVWTLVYNVRGSSPTHVWNQVHNACGPVQFAWIRSTSVDPGPQCVWGLILNASGSSPPYVWTPAMCMDPVVNTCGPGSTRRVDPCNVRGSGPQGMWILVMCVDPVYNTKYITGNVVAVDHIVLDLLRGGQPLLVCEYFHTQDGVCSHGSAKHFNPGIIGI